jgi:hypothetical protein
VRELGQPAEAVWRVVFEEEKAVVLASRQGKTVMEVWSFAPPEDGTPSSTVSSPGLVSRPALLESEPSPMHISSEDQVEDTIMTDETPRANEVSSPVLSSWEGFMAWRWHSIKAFYNWFQGKHRRKDLRRLMNNFRKDKGSKSSGVHKVWFCQRRFWYWFSRHGGSWSTGGQVFWWITKGAGVFFLSFGDFLASRSFSFSKAVDSSAKHSLSPYMHYIKF